VTVNGSKFFYQCVASDALLLCARRSESREGIGGLDSRLRFVNARFRFFVIRSNADDRNRTKPPAPLLWLRVRSPSPVRGRPIPPPAYALEESLARYSTAIAGSALAQAAKSGGRGTRQQDGPSGMGADDARGGATRPPSPGRLWRDRLFVT
jgi:hypothetical protein